MAQDQLADMIDENGRPTVSGSYATRRAMGDANTVNDAATNGDATPRSLAREIAYKNDGQDTTIHRVGGGYQTHRQAVELPRMSGNKGKKAVDESQCDNRQGMAVVAASNTGKLMVARTMSTNGRSTVLSHLRHATSTPNIRGLASLLHPDPLGPGLTLRLQSIEENGFAKSPAPEEIEQWLAALRTSLIHLLGDSTMFNGNNVSASSSNLCQDATSGQDDAQEQEAVQRLIDAMPVPPGYGRPSRKPQSIAYMRDEAEQVVMSAVSRSIPDAHAAQQLHRLSVAMSDADSTYTDAESMWAAQDTKPPSRPAAGRWKQSSFQVTIPEEEVDPTKTGNSPRPSNRRRRQSFMQVTGPGSSHAASRLDDQHFPIPKRSRASSIQPYRSAISPTPKDWTTIDAIEDNVAMAVEGTLGVIREHREYLNKSRAAAKRSEDILVRLAQTPTTSWRAKQKPSLGPYSPATNSASKPQPKPSMPSHAATSGSRRTRGRPVTAMAGDVSTGRPQLTPSTVRSRSGARRRRRSASTGSLARSRSSTVPASRRRSRSLTGNTGRLVDDFVKRLQAGELPHVSKVEAENSKLQRSAGLPGVKEQMISEAAAEASWHGRVLLDATLTAIPHPVSLRTRRSSSRVARLQGRDPPPVPRMSSARARLKQSTFARTARPDHFAPKPEINTRISDRGCGNTTRTRQPSDATSVLTGRGVLFEPRESRPSSRMEVRRDSEAVNPGEPTSPVPAWHRLSQQSTASWSSKGKAPMRDENCKHILHTMVDSRSRSSIRSSLLAPISARISFVGEDFDTAMEGSIHDRSFNAQRYRVDDSKLRAKMRQGSGPNADGHVGMHWNIPHAQQSALLQGLDLASPTEYDEVVTIWHEDAGWLFSVANQKRPSEYEPLTVPLKSVKAQRSSSKIVVPSDEDFLAMVDRANMSLARMRVPTGPGYQGPVHLHPYGLVTHRREPTSFRSKTKNAIASIMAPFNKFGNTFRGSKPRGRRGSTGSLMEGPVVITPGMADDGKIVMGRPVLSHANSLRPEHSPALIRAKGVNGQPPGAMPSRSGGKKTIKPQGRSPLATHTEEIEEDARPAQLGSTTVHEMPATDHGGNPRQKGSEDTIRVWHDADAQWVITQEKVTPGAPAVPSSPGSPLS